MTINIIQGNSFKKLKQIDDESIDCCITSPPYYGLRDYGESDQIGQEDTYQEYIENLVNIFEEVRRVLKSNGTLWLNLGDTYSSGKRRTTTNQTIRGNTNYGVKRAKPQLNIKPKDLMGIPWRVAFALQEKGWYLRQDIIWHKPSPMPESVKDRCTKSHEYIFLFSKNEKYYFDNESIKEKSKYPNGPNSPEKVKAVQGVYSVNLKKIKGNAKKNKRSVWSINTVPLKDAHFATFPPKLIEPMILAGCPETGTVLDPFGGAGTTSLVAVRLKRNAVLIELNEEYIDITKKRLQKDNSLFLEINKE